MYVKNASKNTKYKIQKFQLLYFKRLKSQKI
ncbi:TPA: hypothetical protein ACHHOD_000465 [Staphylococcus aureus]|nr:hypothetical protein [Staphylococcus aureus]MBH4578121.1 hypothetical protein [Staphylococcus aureus]MBH4583272.1 hypothetical protein [Staphylococcus aureus]MBH4586047.1 hypothetical protein [Staphylococcus aureus]MBH4588649.1 hypothetical protein [Staphylococcus aureus]MBH4591156.1 hypothetical protein [Staphylococcus aureus]